MKADANCLCRTLEIRVVPADCDLACAYPSRMRRAARVSIGGEEGVAGGMNTFANRDSSRLAALLYVIRARSHVAGLYVWDVECDLHSDLTLPAGKLAATIAEEVRAASASQRLAWSRAVRAGQSALYWREGGAA
jgi:hypothetical protein